MPLKGRRYHCFYCGNTEAFHTLATIHNTVVIDNKGNFVKWGYDLGDAAVESTTISDTAICSICGQEADTVTDEEA